MFTRSLPPFSSCLPIVSLPTDDDHHNDYVNSSALLLPPLPISALSNRTMEEGHSGGSMFYLLMTIFAVHTREDRLFVRISNHRSLTCVYIALVNIEKWLNGFSRQNGDLLDPRARSNH